MKKLIVLGASALLAAVLVIPQAHGQVPPPPPPPGGNATSTPTLVPTNTPTPLPTATPTPVPLTLGVGLSHSKIKVGQTQKITVSTLPFALLTVSVSFPSGKKDSVNGAANASGQLAYAFAQPSGTTRGSNRSVTVKVKASAGSQTKSSTKKYTIS